MYPRNLKSAPTPEQKLAHYLKIPPRVTFSAQIVATVILSVVSSLSYNFIMGLKDVCTNDAVFNFTCPAQTSFYTTTIFWGVISPKKLFGPGHTYNWMLIGFPLGVVVALGYWALRTTFPQSGFVRLMHPVMFLSGPVSYSAPYNMAYLLGNVYVNLVSFQYVRKRYLEFWSKVRCATTLEAELTLAVELRHQRRLLLRYRAGRAGHLLCAAGAQGRDHRGHLVGQHSDRSWVRGECWLPPARGAGGGILWTGTRHVCLILSWAKTGSR